MPPKRYDIPFKPPNLRIPIIPILEVWEQIPEASDACFDSTRLLDFILGTLHSEANPARPPLSRYLVRGVGFEPTKAYATG